MKMVSASYARPLRLLAFTAIMICTDGHNPVITWFLTAELVWWSSSNDAFWMGKDQLHVLAVHLWSDYLNFCHSWLLSIIQEEIHIADHACITQRV